MEEREERLKKKEKKKRGSGGKYNDGKQYAPLEPSDSEEGETLGTY